MKHFDKYVHVQLDVIHILCMDVNMGTETTKHTVQCSGFKHLQETFAKLGVWKGEEDDDEVLNKTCQP